jgi:all-trans-8'-apo-beta-carotenal 15,15'-oxygenase
MPISLPDRGVNEAPSCRGGLENLDEEHDYQIEQIEGQVPHDLEGTFLRNGPGRQRIGGVPYGHWFDGDGMLAAFSIREGQVRFRNRYVRTPKYVDETTAQKNLYRGIGTQIPGGWYRNAFKLPVNPANTSVVYHAGHLLALNEGGRPWELDARDLSTIGEFDYDGGLFGRTFSAHGKIHPGTGDYVNFGAGTHRQGFKAPSPCINLFRIDPKGKVVASGRAVIDRFPFCHDFGMSERYGVFFIGSIVFGGMGSFFLGTQSIADRIDFDDELPMKILVVDLENFETVREFETDPGAIIHFGNAFEEGDEVVVDGMFAGDFEANQTLGDVFNPDGRFGGGRYHRYRLNLRTGAVGCQEVCEHESEFPTFNPRIAGKRHQACYTACSIDNGANSFFNGIQKVSYEGESTLVVLPPGYYGSEPMFAPAKGASSEDDGYVLEVVYNAFDHVSELQIYRADAFGELLARLYLEHHLPHQFHGFFTPELLLS